MQQGSPLKDQFNNAILELLNKRQLEKLKETWWKNDEMQSKCDKPEDQSDGISIQNIGGVFIVIFGNQKYQIVNDVSTKTYCFFDFSWNWIGLYDISF